jgi:predicted DNA-binding ribbon-helix-helix protein
VSEAKKLQEIASALTFTPGLAKPRKRSLSIAGHETSITIEDAFWAALKEVAAETGCGITELVSAIDKIRQPAGLSASVRVFLLQYYQAKRNS